VFLGRWTSVLRALVPAVAGMSRMPYRRFLVFDVAGGVAWAIVFVSAGFLAGASWQRVERVAGRASLILLVMVALGLLVRWGTRRLAARADAVECRAVRLAAWGPVAAVRTRLGAQLRWVGARLTPGAAHGLGWTLSAVAVVATGWVFVAVIQDLYAREVLVLLDAPLVAWFAAHTNDGVSAVAEIVVRAASPGWGWLTVAFAAAILWRSTRSVRATAMVAIASMAAGLIATMLHLLVPEVAGVRFPSVPATFVGALVVASFPGVARRGWRRAIQAAGVGVMVVAVVSVADLAAGNTALSGGVGGAALGSLLAVLFEFTARTLSPAGPDPATAWDAGATP
jgi:hypothetical protein